MVELTIVVIGALVFVVSALLTGVVRRFAPASGLVVPNSRSFHTLTTARGRGLAVVFAATPTSSRST
jgi:UDP-N-acetylmuramyl pentapeptide phosphotransferase/UDP-N-acetylglucosamine-1-phosphate transferase